MVLDDDPLRDRYVGDGLSVSPERIGNVLELLVASGVDEQTAYRTARQADRYEFRQRHDSLW